MKILNIICSFNTPDLTKRVYEEIKQPNRSVIVLENSTTEEQMFHCEDTVDLGRENIGFGGMHDFIFTNKEYRDYDFVAIYNNDVYNIPSDFVEKLEKVLDPSVGVACPALNDEGTGWQHMRKKGNWIREAQHCEDAIGIFNTKLFPIYERFTPVDYFGILDISLCLLSNANGFRNILLDFLKVDHMLAGARRQSDVFEKYMRESAGSLGRWHNQFPELRDMYDDYIKRYDGVSVIIPNYNHNHLLRRAVESVLKQPIKTEVVVVDDCSPNQDYSMLDGLPVKLVRHDVNKGLATARNTGIKNSYHEWILPLDADDELIDGSLKLLFDNRDADIICGHLIYRNGGLLTSKPNITEEVFTYDNQLVGSSMYHKDVWRNVNGYNEEHHTYFEDWNFWQKAAIRGYKFKNIDQLIYIYQGDIGGMCEVLNRKRKTNADIVRSIGEEYKNWLTKMENSIK